MIELKVIIFFLGSTVIILAYLLYREIGYSKTLMDIKELLADELEKFLFKEAK